MFFYRWGPLENYFYRGLNRESSDNLGANVSLLHIDSYACKYFLTSLCSSPGKACINATAGLKK